MDKANITKGDMNIEVDPCHQKGMIIATLGRSCKNPETLIKMIDAGMNVVRLRLCQGERK
jgi:pyruvate kinase